MLKILAHFFFLSSAPTTPLIRDPMGSPDLLIKTQALSSNLIIEPSCLCVRYRVRTTTACRMSPRLTLLAAEVAAMPSLVAERCCWTTQTMRSPMRAWRFWPAIWAHSTRAAPELSIQFRIVCGERFSRVVLSCQTRKRLQNNEPLIGSF